jgi:hypothetical protein
VVDHINYHYHHCPQLEIPVFLTMVGSKEQIIFQENCSLVYDNYLDLVSIIIKKEESPIVVTLYISANKEIKNKEQNPLPSLCYPSTSSQSGPSSRLSFCHTCLPALCFSPVGRGEETDSTYHPTMPIRSPSSLDQPIDWEPVYQHGETINTIIIPSTTSSRIHVNPISYALCRVRSL